MALYPPISLKDGGKASDAMRYVLTRTPHPSGISTTNMFSLRYACDNIGLCVRSYRDADGALSVRLY